MAEITASLVKQLRDATSVSMMDCKRALVEAGGDIEQATKLLRERGVAVAAKRSTKATNQGVIASATTDDGKYSSLVEVNCETDFVARNEDFQSFVQALAVKACLTDGNLADEVKDEVMDKVAAVGENIVIKRNTRMELNGIGCIVPYIHLGGKVGVLVEISCEKKETLDNDIFNELTKDLAMHVAACSPRYLTSQEIPEAETQAEREIYAKQVEGKPANMIDKIVNGKLQKYFGETCFLNQPFVKEDKLSVTQYLAEKSKAIGDNISIKRFARYQLGA